MGRPQRAPPQPLSECERATIEIALAAPFAGVVDREFYPKLPSKTAVLLYTLARSQACPDGNKRAAVILTEAFVALNGHTLETTNDELEAQVRAAAECDAREREAMLARLAEWLNGALVPLRGEGT